MLRKEICESNSFASLKDSNSQLLCILLTSWWDDHGKMIGDEIWIQGNIVRKLPQFTIKEIKRCLINIDLNTDVQWWIDEFGCKWLYWSNFDKHQTISQEKKTKDILPSPKIPKNPQKSLGEHHQQDEVKDEVKDEEEGRVKQTYSDFFSYYLLKTKKAFKLTKSCRDLIDSRLKDGFTIDQMKTAVDNFVQDDWVDRSKHLDLIYCIGKQKGKPDNLEKWLNIKKTQEPVT